MIPILGSKTKKGEHANNAWTTPHCNYQHNKLLSRFSRTKYVAHPQPRGGTTQLGAAPTHTHKAKSKVYPPSLVRWCGPSTHTHTRACKGSCNLQKSVWVVCVRVHCTCTCPSLDSTFDYSTTTLAFIGDPTFNRGNAVSWHNKISGVVE